MFERNRRRAGRCTGKFSLIEMLIVLSIVTILACLLLPILQKAQRQGLVTSCANNLRGCGQMITLYCDTYQGFTPEGIPVQYSTYALWGRLMIDLGYYTAPQVGREHPLLCPEAPPYKWFSVIQTYALRGALPTSGIAKSTHFRCGGSMTDTGNAAAGLAPKRYTSGPSQFVLLFDSLANTGLGWSAYAFANPDCFGLFHPSGGGVLFFDGHTSVASKKYDYLNKGRMVEEPTTLWPLL